MVFDQYDNHEPVLEDSEVELILSYLREWAYSHPRPDEVFLFQMGRAWTPIQFYQEVEDRTCFGKEFLRFLFVQAERSQERPHESVLRTLKATFR